MKDEAIYSLLTNDAGVSALVSGRVYPLGLPQNAVQPCVSYSVSEEAEDETFDGQGGVSQADILIDCWATTYDEAQAVAQAVKSALQNNTGLVAGVNIQRLILERSLSVIEDDVDLYRTTQSFIMNA